MKHRVVIVGGGFGGLYCAKSLPEGGDLEITLVDKRNFHLFQPLLYQIATGGLSPGDIASPLRAVLARKKNTRVLQAEVLDIDVGGRRVILNDGHLEYDTLVVAAGASHHYFGHDDWASYAPGLKTIEDALEMRQRIFSAFERAERTKDPERRKMLLTFVLVGGGPTGVELAGALAELARHTLKGEFRDIDPSEARVLLVEGMDRILPPYPKVLSQKARRTLEKLGVEVKTEALITDLGHESVTLRERGQSHQIRAGTVLWAAGVAASPLGKLLSKKSKASMDKAGRVMVQKDLTIPGHPEIFVIGDLACVPGKDGRPLPGVAPVAMQQGEYVADVVGRRLSGNPTWPFTFKNKGNLAVIGRNAAVADLGGVTLSGFPAWLLWVFIHIRYLIEFDNKMLVLFQWAWNYFTRKRGARLITGDSPVLRSGK